MLIAVLKKKFIVSFIIIFGTLSFPVESFLPILTSLCSNSSERPHRCCPIANNVEYVEYTDAGKLQHGQLYPQKCPHPLKGSDP